MPNTWKHYWAVMIPAPDGRWVMWRYETEADAKEHWRRIRKEQPAAELMEQYVRLATIRG